jgi:hypothetical protein
MKPAICSHCVTGHCGVWWFRVLDVYRLADGEYHRVGEGLGGGRDTRTELAQVHVPLGHAVGQFGGQHPARWRWCGCLGLDLLSQAFGDHAYCRLGCRMERASWPNDTTSARPHIDDVTTARRLHLRQRGADA